MVSILLRSILFFFTIVALSTFSWIEAKSFISLDVPVEETFSFLFQSFMYATAMFIILWGGAGILTMVMLLLKKI
jgi:hypothetical protein